MKQDPDLLAVTWTEGVLCTTIAVLLKDLSSQYGSRAVAYALAGSDATKVAPGDSADFWMRFLMVLVWILILSILLASSVLMRTKSGEWELNTAGVYLTNIMTLTFNFIWGSFVANRFVFWLASVMQTGKPAVVNFSTNKDSFDWFFAANLIISIVFVPIWLMGLGAYIANEKANEKVKSKFKAAQVTRDYVLRVLDRGFIFVYGYANGYLIAVTFGTWFVTSVFGLTVVSAPAYNVGWALLAQLIMNASIIVLRALCPSSVSAWNPTAAAPINWMFRVSEMLRLSMRVMWSVMISTWITFGAVIGLMRVLPGYTGPIVSANPNCPTKTDVVPSDYSGQWLLEILVALIIMVASLFVHRVYPISEVLARFIPGRIDHDAMNQKERDAITGKDIKDMTEEEINNVIGQLSVKSNALNLGATDAVLPFTFAVATALATVLGQDGVVAMGSSSPSNYTFCNAQQNFGLKLAATTIVLALAGMVLAPMEWTYFSFGRADMRRAYLDNMVVGARRVPVVARVALKTPFLLPPVFEEVERGVEDFTAAMKRSSRIAPRSSQSS